MSWFRPCVRRRKKNLKYIFPLSGIFPGKANIVILLCFECTINPQNLIKIVGAIFEKIKILNFLLCELLLILRVDRKRKKKRDGDICKGTRDIECARDWSVGLGATLGDGQKIKN